MNDFDRYANTFTWLYAYDNGLLDEPAAQQQGGSLPTLAEARTSIQTLKRSLVAKGEAGDLFGQEQDDRFAAILGNLNQTVGGQPAYPTIETKAAHLLYFVVKDHPFADGNKRIGASLFVDFLHRHGRLLNHADDPIINDNGLAALTLWVATSTPKEKDVITRLTINVLVAGNYTN